MILGLVAYFFVIYFLFIWVVLDSIFVNWLVIHLLTHLCMFFH
jgi:hypothetical protein